jgi:hypothetical protein
MGGLILYLAAIKFFIKDKLMVDTASISITRTAKVKVK